MNSGYLRVAGLVPIVSVADCRKNAVAIISECTQLNEQDVKVAVLPELSITGCTCGDLFFSDTLHEGVRQAIRDIVRASTSWNMLVFVGIPIKYQNNIYDCAVAIAKGKILAVVPKTNIPIDSNFKSAKSSLSGSEIEIDGNKVPFGTDIMFRVGEALIGVEINEDVSAPIAPSQYATTLGAHIILNLSAANDEVGKYDLLKQQLVDQSRKCCCAYVYAGAGYGESTTDFVYDGKVVICENGVLMAESNRWNDGVKKEIVDIDMDLINKSRLMSVAFSVNENGHKYQELETFIDNHVKSHQPIGRIIERNPFVPSDKIKLHQICEDAVNIQMMGLMKRLQFTNTKTLVIGVSGGLDSTLALLVAVKAFDRLKIDRRNIYAITMPGFGTTGRTKSNACELMTKLGVTMREISIVDAVMQHFSDIGHDINVQNITYENAQARERTQILMDVANQVNGMVLGTGDMSELALGWATYNGDHMSMYGVNAGVPKTLIKEIVKWLAYNEFVDCATILKDVVETPISPELIPADENGEIKQKTEDNVGPYELHDFFLYYVLKLGYSPAKIFNLAQIAFNGDYEDDVIKKWLRTFFRRFFTQQFKRSCLPDGPKVCEVSLSPREGLSMPSDASVNLWLDECDKL